MTYTLKANAWAISKVRQDNNIKTDAELARSLGISPYTLSKIKNGARPPVAFIAGMLTVYGIGVDDDLYEIEEVSEAAA